MRKIKQRRRERCRGGTSLLMQPTLDEERPGTSELLWAWLTHGKGHNGILSFLPVAIRRQGRGSLIWYTETVSGLPLGFLMMVGFL